MYVGTDGDHQNEFIRGERLKDLFRNSISTPSLVATITETAKLNDLNVYYYLKYLLEELPQRIDVDRNISSSDVDNLLPWSKTLPKKLSQSLPLKKRWDFNGRWMV